MRELPAPMGSIFPRSRGESGGNVYSPEYMSCILRMPRALSVPENIFGEVGMYRFGQVAHAIGMGEPALRNWLRRNKIDLFEAQPETGWRVFTENDVFVLAIAAVLVGFGAEVKPAVEAVRSGLGDTNFKTWEGRPDRLYAVRSPFGDGWIASSDHAYVSGMTRRGLVELAIPEIMIDTRNRLKAYAQS